ncbi:uncharacterized protein A4U43_C08F17380 [Asparagus officinalis]|nr:uncharacterized protein A4U43_C08F17380 [Asparagus officinalis]
MGSQNPRGGGGRSNPRDGGVNLGSEGRSGQNPRGGGFDMVRFSNISDAKSSSNILKMETRGIGVSEMEEMPCVSTTGNSPNGKRVEGFLYKYRKGEEVRIVCVCHGSFLTPAEFVRHAGLGDVDHPLRHIVVNPPSPFL